MTTSLAVAELLSGDDGLPAGVRSELDWVRAIQSGLSPAAVDAAVEELCFTPAEIERLVMPRRTLAHRRANGQALTREESDRLARITRVALTTQEVFGNAEKASTWLRRPNRALLGSVPIDLLDTDDGARLVEQVLGRLAHGVFS